MGITSLIGALLGSSGESTRRGAKGSGNKPRLEGSVDPNAPDEDIAVWESKTAERKHFICAIGSNVADVREFGTGILIGPDLVLTNYHVVATSLEDPRRARTLRCRFDYYSPGRDLAPNEGREVALAGSDWHVVSSPYSTADGEDSGHGTDELDYAIVKLAEPIGNQPLGDEMSDFRGWEPLPTAPRIPAVNETIFLLHHPVNETVQPPQLPLRRSENRVMEILDNGLRIRHAATTSPGSSGGPCFGMNQSFLGLHHATDPSTDQNRTRWNQAIPLREIVRHLTATGHKSIVGSMPPASASAAPAFVRRPPATVQKSRIGSDVFARRLQVAKILMDRNVFEDNVISVRSRKGIVHVIVCREVDRHLRFLERLMRLSFLIESGGLSSREQRLAFLKSTEKEGGNSWQKVNFTWPSPRLAPSERVDYLLSQLGPPDLSGKRWLIEVVAAIDECSYENEKKLVTTLAARCLQRAMADNLQIFFVYYDAVSTADADKRKDIRRQFGAMWQTEAEIPPGCGVCLGLDDIGPSDLVPWCGDLQAAWDVDETELRGQVKTKLSGATKLAMSEVELRLDPVIKECIESSIAIR